MSKKKTSSQLSLHELICQMSFWGTSVRLLLFSFLAAVVFAFALSEASTSSAADSQIMQLIYVLGSFFILDFGYVMIARSYPLKRSVDMVFLATADVILALLYILPKSVVASTITTRENPLVYVFIIAIGVLSMRLLVGLLIGNPSRR